MATAIRAHPRREGRWIQAGIKLSALAGVIEGAIGWLGGHLHAFEVGGVIFDIPDGEGFRTTLDERTVRLADVLPAVESTMRWDYDFGDGWEHDIVVEAVEPRQVGVTYPVCLAGERACPSEDCGGPWGYDDLLAAVAEPTHERHEEFIEWVPAGFDPEAFDVDVANEMMRWARPLPEW